MKLALRAIIPAALLVLSGTTTNAVPDLPLPTAGDASSLGELWAEPLWWASACINAGSQEADVSTSVFSSYAEIDTSAGYAAGLSQRFCVFQTETAMGMVGLETLGSYNPSFAATYIHRGIDLEEIGDPPETVGNPGTWYCEQLQGSSVSRYANGGFLSPGGEDEVCVFGDGSMVSIWVLVYISLPDPGPGYLSIRSAIQSQPLALDLPFMGDL
jgi:hypothetical protein